MTFRGRALCLLLAMLGVWVQAQEPEIDTLERGWRAIRSDLTVSIDPKLNSIQVRGELLARLEHREARELVLMMNSRARVMEFESIEVGGASVDLNQQHPNGGTWLLAVVRFEEAKRRGDQVRIAFQCRSVGNGSQFVTDASISLASWIEGWYPSLAPEEGSSFSAATRAQGVTSFRLPYGWRSVSSGRLVKRKESNDGVFETWDCGSGLSRSYAAGPYSVLSDSSANPRASLYLLANDSPYARTHAKSLADAIGALESRLGPFPFESYAIAEVPLRAGAFAASSEQGFMMVKPFFFQSPVGNLPLYAHEAAHAWWGNSVGAAGIGGLVCSESLAQYGAVLAIESVWGREAALEFLSYSRPGYVSNQCARGYFQLVASGLDKALSSLESGPELDHTLATSKGHWVFHMLRERIGDDAFFEVLNDLIRSYDGRAMTLRQLRAEFIEAAPASGLERFFSQWFDRPGAPVLWHEWEWRDNEVHLKLQQRQGGQPFDIHLDVGLHGAGGDLRIERVHLHELEQEFSFSADEEVKRVQLDPQERLLLWRAGYGEPPVPMNGVRLDPPPAILVGALPGTYHFSDSRANVEVFVKDGQLMMRGGESDPLRLQHTGENRFRTETGWVVFGVQEGKGVWLLSVSDLGQMRRATRR